MQRQRIRVLPEAILALETPVDHVPTESTISISAYDFCRQVDYHNIKL